MLRSLPRKQQMLWLEIGRLFDGLRPPAPHETLPLPGSTDRPAAPVPPAATAILTTGFRPGKFAAPAPPAATVPAAPPPPALDFARPAAAVLSKLDWTRHSAPTGHPAPVAAAPVVPLPPPVQPPPPVVVPLDPARPAASFFGQLSWQRQPGAAAPITSARPASVPIPASFARSAAAPTPLAAMMRTATENAIGTARHFAAARDFTPATPPPPPVAPPVAPPAPAPGSSSNSPFPAASSFFQSLAWSRS